MSNVLRNASTGQPKCRFGGKPDRVLGRRAKEGGKRKQEEGWKKGEHEAERRAKEEGRRGGTTKGGRSAGAKHQRDRARKGCQRMPAAQRINECESAARSAIVHYASAPPNTSLQLFMFTQIALQLVTLKARSLRLKGLNHRQFRRFSHERQERGLSMKVR